MLPNKIPYIHNNSGGYSRVYCVFRDVYKILMFQTNHLVIIGGPSAVGKSSLQTRILQGDMPSLCKQLCVDLPSSYLFIDAHELPEVRQKCVNHLILHYDFLTQYSIRDGYAYLPDLISTSCRVIALTLCTASNLLFHRIYLP